MCPGPVLPHRPGGLRVALSPSRRAPARPPPSRGSFTGSFAISSNVCPCACSSWILRHQPTPPRSSESMRVARSVTKASSAVSTALRYCSSITNSSGSPISSVKARPASIEPSSIRSRLARLVSRLEQLVGSQSGGEREGGLEGGVLLLRRRDELGEPVLHLGAARLGDRVDGALGTLAVLDGLLRLDQPVPGQRLHDGVERAEVDLDARLLAARAQLGRDLVGVRRPLRDRARARPAPAGWTPAASP